MLPAEFFPKLHTAQHATAGQILSVLTSFLLLASLGKKTQRSRQQAFLQHALQRLSVLVCNTTLQACSAKSSALFALQPTMLPIHAHAPFPLRKPSRLCLAIPANLWCSRWQRASTGKHAAGLMDIHTERPPRHSHCALRKRLRAGSTNNC